QAAGQHHQPKTLHDGLASTASWRVQASVAALDRAAVTDQRITRGGREIQDMRPAAATQVADRVARTQLIATLGLTPRLRSRQSNHSSSGSNFGNTTISTFIFPIARCRVPGRIMMHVPGCTLITSSLSCIFAPGPHSRK